MAAEEDGDVFEITDFTTASEWERFISRLEEVLHEWKLVNRDPLPYVNIKGKFSEGLWEEKSEEILFADFHFLITYTRLKSKSTASSDGFDASEPATASENSLETKEREENEDENQEDEHKTPTVMNDIITLDNDFPSRAHCLCRWYGLQEFLIVQPAPNFGIIDSESRAKILESSAAIALSNSACHVPLFIQLQQKWRKLYCGISVVDGADVKFEMSHLKKLPPRYMHLDGLVDMFKAKLGCEYISMPPVSVSVRFTYILEDWIHCPWPQQPPDFSTFSEGEVGCSELDILPFGACEDPVSELHLSCTWPCLSADMIIETSGYTDLDPLQAPQWSVRIQMTEDPQCLLGEYLQSFIELCSHMETTEEILGRSVNDSSEQQSQRDGVEDITNVLHRLTEPNLPYRIPSLGSVVSQASSRLEIKPEEAPIPLKVLNQILLHLFPDAIGLDSSGREREVNSQSRESTPIEETPPPGTNDRLEEVQNEALKQLKSAPPNSLSHRLAVCFIIVNSNYGGLRAVAHLWQEFILEMRYRWENNIVIPNLGTCSSSKSSSSAQAPNLGSCLLHQKLQMLNCCIERKIKRETAGYGQENTILHEASTFDKEICVPDNDNDSTQAAVVRVGSVGSFSDEDEDEFFECEGGDEVESEVDEENNGKAKSIYYMARRAVSNKQREKSMDSSMSEVSFRDATLIKPEGRLAPIKNARSLATDDALFIPITQDPSPMTEDMLEEQAEVLAKLGSSAEGSQLRARMQSACLLSDMESFKAANPGCCLEDFVRWYSPRDYIEDEEEEEEVREGEEELGEIKAVYEQFATQKETDHFKFSDNPERDILEQSSDFSENRYDLSPPDSKMNECWKVFSIDSKPRLAASSSGRQKRGHLSQRMQIPGNVWVEVWQSARHVPARRQKRLFDDTKEAEKILHFLSGLRPGEIVLHLLPMVTHACILTLAEREDRDVPMLRTLTDQVLNRASKVTRSPHSSTHLNKYQDLVRMIELAETVSSRAQSLKTKFTKDLLDRGKAEEELHHFVTSLLQQPEVEVRGGAYGPVGAAIHKLFSASQKAALMILEEDEKDPKKATEKVGMAEALRNSNTAHDFPNPSAREYVLRAMIPRPAPYSRVLPQRMFCVLVDGDYRLAGAFCQDTTFQ